jgi:hypothetical protein
MQCAVLASLASSLPITLTSGETLVPAGRLSC